MLASDTSTDPLRDAWNSITRERTVEECRHARRQILAQGRRRKKDGIVVTRASNLGNDRRVNFGIVGYQGVGLGNSHDCCPVRSQAICALPYPCTSQDHGVCLTAEFTRARRGHGHDFGRYSADLPVLLLGKGEYVAHSISPTLRW